MHRDRRHGMSLAHHRASLNNRAASDTAQQSHGKIQRFVDDCRIHATFKAAGGFRAQLVASARPRDGDLIPVCCLEKHVRGLIGDLGGRTTHHTCQGLDAIVISNNHIFSVQLALHMIQRGQLLPLAGAANVEGTIHLVGVEGMHGRTQQEHQVVSHVRCCVDRARTAEHQFALHPQWRFGLRINAHDLAHTEDGALGVLIDGDVLHVTFCSRQASKEVVVQRCSSWVSCWIAELQIEARCELTGQTTSRQSVSAVRGDVDVENSIFQPQQLTRIIAHAHTAAIEFRLRNGHDASILHLRQAHFHGGADHAFGHLAVSLTRADLETTRQHRARKRNDHIVALGEVASTTDDVLQLARAVGLPHIDLAVADRLLKALQLLDFFHAAEY